MKEPKCDSTEEAFPGTCVRNILRRGMIAELGAINDYEAMAEASDDPNVRAQLMSIAKEEKTHFGEFQALLLVRDPEQVKELNQGKDEVVKSHGNIGEQAYKIAEEAWVRKRMREGGKSK